MPTDAELVPLAAGGDVEAFERLWTTYHAFVGKQVLRFLFFDERRLAPDVEADVWGRLGEGRWRLKPSYAESDGTLYKFLTALTRYAVHSAREDDRLARLISLDAPAPFSDGDDRTAWIHRLHAPSVDPLDAMIAAEEVGLLRRALAGLDDRERRLLRWRYVDGLTVREIAERERRTTGTLAETLTRIHDGLAAACGTTYTPPTRGRYQRDVAGTTQYGKASARYRARQHAEASGAA